MASKKEVKKDFEELAEEIEDLKEIEEELNSLDTRGFKKEDTYIRSRLKDVKAVPELRKRIKVLKSSILERNLKAGKGKLGSELLAEQEALKEEIAGADRDLERIEKKVSSRRRKQLSKDEVEDVRDIPALERQLKKIKEKFSDYTKSATISRRIKNLENQIAKKRRTRRQLSDSEVEDVKDIHVMEEEVGLLEDQVKKLPKFKGEIATLKREIEKGAKQSYVAKKLSELADYVRRKTSKKQLTKSQVSDVEDIPYVAGTVNEIVDQMDSFAKASYLKRKLNEIDKKLDRRTKATVSEVGKMGSDLAKKERTDRREVEREMEEIGIALTKKEEADRRAAKREVGKIRISLDHDRKVGNEHFILLDNKIDRFLEEFESHEKEDKKQLAGINSLLKSFKEEFENVLEHELAEYDTIENKIDHSQDYVKSELPVVERELAEFKREFEEHLHSADIPIDTGVGTLVDSRFDDFVGSLKAGVNTKMKKHMKMQEKMFDDKVEKVRDMLEEEYERKVEMELRQEVEDRFDKEFEAALKEAKKQMLAELKEKQDREVDRLRTRLESAMKKELSREVKHEKEVLRGKMYDKVRKEVVGRLLLEKQRLAALLELQYKRAESVLEGEIEREVEKLNNEANRNGKKIDERFVETEDGDIVAEVRRIAVVKRPKRTLDGEEANLKDRLKKLMGYDPDAAGMVDDR